jgi:predicted anti-sigma-YlaC factor YlaD
MNCRIARRWVLRELDRDLSVDQALELDAHVASCRACRVLSQRAAVLDEALLALGEPPVERLDVERSVRAIAGRIDVVELERGRRVRALRVAGALATAVAIVAVFAWEVLRHPAAPRTPDVASEGPRTQPAATGLPPPPREAVADSNEPALDIARLEAAREEVREHLRAAATDLPELAARPAALAFAAKVDAARDTPTLVAWPIVRIAGGLTADGDPLVARAAKRYLGVRGDRLAQRVLQDRWSADNSDREALLALLDIGEPAFDVLVQGCRHRDVGELARSRLSDDALAVRVLERALRDASAEPEQQAPLVDELVRRGPDAALALLRLARDAALERDTALRALDRVPQARRVLGELVQSESSRANPSGFDADLMIAACARVQPPEAVNWLAAQCRDPHRRPAALDALSAYEAPDAFAALLDLQREARLDRGDLTLPLDARFARGSEHLLALTEDFIAADAGHATAWLELLVERADPLAGPSLTRIAAAPTLPEEDRELAARAVGDFGRANDVRRLTEVFRALDGRERRLAAVCVDSIHRLGGDEAVSNLLAGAPRRHTERVLDVLRKRSPESVSLVQLSRALDPVIEHSLDRGSAAYAGTHP